MTVGKLQSQVKALTAHGRKLTAEDVRKLVGAAKDGPGVSKPELGYLSNLPADAFEAGAKDRLTEMLGGVQAKAYVNVAASTATDAGFGAGAKTGAPGVTLRTEDGTGQLTQNCFWLEGKATGPGKVEVALDGKTVSVAAKKGESAATLAARLAKALPKGYSLNVNGNFPGGKTAMLQVFRMEAPPAALVQPVVEGKAPPIRVVITGYGKFANYATDADNPAWQLAQKAAQAAYPGAKVEAVLLPVEWGKVEDFTKTVQDKYHPDVVISLGAGPHGLEYWAQNKTEGADAAGAERHGEPADPNGPEFLEMSLPERQMEEALEKVEDPSKGGTLDLHADRGAPREQRLAQAKQSQIDADNTYLCNYLNYRMIEATRGTGIVSGFIHVDETTAPQELQAVIQACVNQKLRDRAEKASAPVA